MQEKNKSIWREAFGNTLEKIMDLYSINYCSFCKMYQINPATFRYWRTGARLPRIELFSNIKHYFQKNIPDDLKKNTVIRQFVFDFMKANGYEQEYKSLINSYPEINVFVGEVLDFYRNMALNKSPSNIFPELNIEPTGRTQVIVFDFDGTLTDGKYTNTTWEKIWIALGYSERDCQELHQRFNHKEISHAEWCKITENKFKSRKLSSAC